MTTFSHAELTITAAWFDSLWEGALIAGAVWLGLRCLPKLGASTRHAIWLCALVAVVLTPLLTVRLSERLPQPVTDTAVTSRERSTPIAPLALPRIETARVAPEPAGIANGAIPTARIVQSVAIPAAGRTSRIAVPQSLVLVAALIWLLVAGARGLRLLLDVRDLAAIRRDARPWPSAHDYPILLSDRVQVPLAAGFVHPAIILPASLVERLPADAVETIVIHEVAHLRRYDVWTNALVRIAEASLALNPAAGFVVRRLATEREIACDDWVVARTGSGAAFARTLAVMACRVGARMPLAAPSAFGSRHALVVRIERLLDSRPRRLRLSPPALGGALALLALFALALQSVSPVLAYQPQPATLAQAPGRATGSCAEPDRGIRISGYDGLRLHAIPHSAGPWDGYELRSARDIVARFGAANVATFDLTVDAAGTVRKVVLVSGPSRPNLAQDVTRRVMIGSYRPATHDCVPVTSTIRTGVALGKPYENTYSTVVPTYPKGWSAQHASACKVPTLSHTGVPAFPEAMKGVPPGRTYNTVVRVHVDGSGAATNAVVVSSSGQPAFDDALVAAARQTTYPLTESTGFKQVRPAGAALSWNASHGSSTYVDCKPLPADYVWTTSFGRYDPIGFPGTLAIVRSH